MSSKLLLDKIDRDILDLLRKDPEITHSKIANEVGRSQPAVGKRIKRLEKNGHISYQVGPSLRHFDFIFIKIAIQTKDPTNILKIAKKCPFMPISFKLTGKNNINIIAYGHSLKFLSNLLSYHFKGEEGVKSIAYEVILNINEDLVLPIDLHVQNCEYLQNNKQEAQNIYKEV